MTVKGFGSHGCGEFGGLGFRFSVFGFRDSGFGFGIRIPDFELIIYTYMFKKCKLVLQKYQIWFFIEVFSIYFSYTTLKCSTLLLLYVQKKFITTFLFFLCQGCHLNLNFTYRNCTLTTCAMLTGSNVIQFSEFISSNYIIFFKVYFRATNNEFQV